MPVNPVTGLAQHDHVEQRTRNYNIQRGHYEEGPKPTWAPESRFPDSSKIPQNYILEKRRQFDT